MERPSPGQLRGLVIVALLGLLLVGSVTVMARPPGELPERKQAVAARLQDRQATVVAIATQVNRPPGAPPPRPTFSPVIKPTSTPWTGISIHKQSAFSRRVAGETQWQDFVNGQFTVVITGALRDDPEESVLIVQRGRSPSDDEFAATFFNPPTKSGALTITAVSPGLQFTLRAKNGTTFVFDLPSRTFVGAAAGTSTPTATPRPATTPTPTITPTPRAMTTPVPAGTPRATGTSHPASTPRAGLTPSPTPAPRATATPTPPPAPTRP